MLLYTITPHLRGCSSLVEREEVWQLVEFKKKTRLSAHSAIDTISRLCHDVFATIGSDNVMLRKATSKLRTPIITEEVNKSLVTTFRGLSTGDSKALIDNEEASAKLDELEARFKKLMAEVGAQPPRGR